MKLGKYLPKLGKFECNEPTGIKHANLLKTTDMLNLVFKNTQDMLDINCDSISVIVFLPTIEA